VFLKGCDILDRSVSMSEVECRLWMLDRGSQVPCDRVQVNEAAKGARSGRGCNRVACLTRGQDEVVLIAEPIMPGPKRVVNSEVTSTAA